MLSCVVLCCVVGPGGSVSCKLTRQEVGLGCRSAGEKEKKRKEKHMGKKEKLVICRPALRSRAVTLTKQRLRILSDSNTYCKLHIVARSLGHLGLPVFGGGALVFFHSAGIYCRIIILVLITSWHLSV